MNKSINQSRRFNEEHRISSSERIEYGYKDGGRGLKFNRDGSYATSPTREIIIVKNPSDDPIFQSALEYVKQQLNKLTSTEQKIRFLSGYVQGLLSINDTAENERIMDRICGGNSRGYEISLGQLIQAKTGVCRHRSLLFKALADEIGMPTSLVRGNYYEHSGYGVSHAWNEVDLENGETLIVDVMHDFIGDLSSAKVKKYLDVNNNALYAHRSQNTPKIQHRQTSVNSIIIRGDWQEAKTTKGDKIIRLPTRSLTNETVTALETQLEQHGLSPVIYESKSLGQTIRLSNKDVERFKLLQERLSTESILHADWLDVTDRDGKSAKYLKTDRMTNNERAVLEAALTAQGIIFSRKRSALDGGINVLSISNPKSIAAVKGLFTSFSAARDPGTTSSPSRDNNRSSKKLELS
ncbi:MAG: EDR1-related protein [Pseudomonadota bacterium]